MIDLAERSKIPKSQLLRAAKTNPESVKRLAKYLKLRTEGYSVRQIARLINWLLNKRLEFRR
jgi:hypothetical protein